jgi:curved DNA-binding protein CbpA
VPHRDPHAVLGVDPGASQATIKSAWRRLAREHHPDLAGADAAAARRATRRMAEINAAYETLRTPGASRAASATRRPGAGPPSTEASASPGRGRPSGPPPSPRTRPVTGRVDTSQTARPRNATVGRPARPAGQPPLRPDRTAREPLRASDPNGPIHHGRMKRYRRPPDPELDEALTIEIEFGKFRGHTLGEIAAFEPSYIDWVAKTITRDRDLVSAARVVQADLDRRGVVRRVREPATTPARSPFAGPID